MHHGDQHQGRAFKRPSGTPFDTQPLAPRLERSLTLRACQPIPPQWHAVEAGAWPLRRLANELCVRLSDPVWEVRPDHMARAPKAASAHAPPPVSHRPH